ncbi:hypothetical protein STEG23_010256 [Scotinomys teguina]
MGSMFSSSFSVALVLRAGERPVMKEMRSVEKSCVMTGGIFIGLITGVSQFSSDPILYFPSEKSRPHKDITKTSRIILNKYGESGQPCLVPDFRGIALSFSPFNLMFVYMVNYIDRFSYVEPALHPWNEAYLVMVDNFLMHSWIWFANILSG